MPFHLPAREAGKQILVDQSEKRTVWFIE